jgi:hypothetical protein
MLKTKTKIRKGSLNGRKKTVRAKTYTKKKTRNKRVAKTKSKIYGNTKTRRSNKPKTARRIISKTKSRNIQRARKTIETRSTSRIQTSGRRILSERDAVRARNRKWSQPAKRISKNQGYTSTIHVKKSKYYPNKTLILKKSETTLTKKNSIKLSRNTSQVEKVLKTLSTTAKKKFKQLGKSKDDLRMLKLQYTYTLQSERRMSYFSSTVAKITSDTEVDLALEDLVKEFEGQLKNYLQSGFSDIRISGVRMHAYEEENLFNSRETEYEYDEEIETKKPKRKKKRRKK